MSNGPKEDIYDEKISPLVKQIIKLCHEHEINSMLHFILDENTDEESEDFGDVSHVHREVRRRRRGIGKTAQSTRRSPAPANRHDDGCVWL